MMASPSTAKDTGRAQRKLITYGRPAGRRQRSDANGNTELEEAPRSPKVARPSARVAADLSNPVTDSSLKRHVSATSGQVELRLQAERHPHRPDRKDNNDRKRKRSLPSRAGSRESAAGTSAVAPSANSSKQSNPTALASEPKGAKRSHFARGSPSPSKSGDGNTKDVSSVALRTEHSHASSSHLSDDDVLISPQYADVSQRNTAVRGRRPRRPRLIDTLAGQTSESPDRDPVHEFSGVIQRSIDGIRTPLGQRSVAARDARSRPTFSNDKLKGRKIRFTYSQSRSVFAEPQQHEESLLEDTDFATDPLLSDSILPDPTRSPSPSAFAFPEDDEEIDGAAPKVAIKSVHELRRAGANNRFSDEMEDLLIRIGVPYHHPSTMRRNALLELATKLSRDDFAEQFRDHSSRDKVAARIEDEQDMISGFAATAALIIFLTSGPAPNLLRQLAEEGVAKLLSRQLRENDDIDNIASLKTMNLSKATRASVHNLKTLLMKLKLWHGYDLSSLSPRTVALQLLDIFTRYSDAPSLEKVAGQLESDLLEVANLFAQPVTQDHADCALTLSILEAQSNVAIIPEDSSEGTSRRSPVVARLLHKTLKRWPHERNDLDATTLKLSINTTNTSEGAEAFNNGAMLMSLTDCICAGISKVQRSVSSRQLEDDVYEGLLLVLGVFINIVEHLSPARTAVDPASLQELMGLYLDNHMSMSEADSVEKSKLSVAFGYLAVLLGYLSLTAPIRAMMRAQARGGGIRSLVGSVQEFINMYKNVDSKVQGLEGLVNELRQLQDFD